MKYRFFSSAVVCVGVAACGTGGGSNPSFWEPSHDVGGTQYDPVSLGGASAAGAPATMQAGAGNSSQRGSGGARGSGGRSSAGAGGTESAGGSETSAGGSPPGGSGGSGGGSVVMDPPPGNSGACNFTFNVTTVTAHGLYSPNNVGALWIEDSGGKFVKSLEVWGSQRLSNLTAWTSVSGNNTVDAVTSATLRNHGPHSGKWNCSNVSHVSVPNGSYQACVSFAEDDSFGGFFGAAPHVACTPFNKGVAATVSPPDQPNFTAMTLIMQ